MYALVNEDVSLYLRNPCPSIACGHACEFWLMPWSIVEERVLLVAATGFEPVAKGL